MKARIGTINPRDTLNGEARTTRNRYLIDLAKPRYLHLSPRANTSTHIFRISPSLQAISERIALKIPRPHIPKSISPSSNYVKGVPMKIKMSKAVEILDLNIKEAGNSMPADVKASLLLAISNMKATMFVRTGGRWDPHALLPDELPYQDK